MPSTKIDPAVEQLVAAIEDGLKWQRLDGEPISAVTNLPDGFDIRLQDGRILQMRVRIGGGLMTRTKRAMYWVLHNGEHYFQEWTATGPRCTKVRGEAMRFPSKRKAMQHEAYSFPLMSFEPEAIRRPGE